MDCKKFIMSSNEKVQDPPNSNDSSEDDFHGQSEKVDRNPTRTVTAELTLMGELETAIQSLPSARSVKMSCQLSNLSSTPILQAPNIYEDNQSTDAYSSRELWNRTNYPHSENALISPRPNTAASGSVVEVSDVSGSKTAQNNLSPFSANCNTNFPSPPDRGTIPVIKSFSKNLKETNAPSPEKRSVDTDVVLTPTKKLKNTPESDSRKHEIETESYRSNLSLSTATSYKSPTNLQVQLFKTPIQKTEESAPLNSPSAPIERKMARNSFGESKAENDPCLSNVSSTTPGSNIVRKSPTNLQMPGTDIAVQNDESSTEKNPSLSFRYSSSESNSPTDNYNPDELLQTASFLILPLKEPESEKQRDGLSTPDVSFESEQSEFSVKEFELAVHPPKLTDAASSSNAEKFPNSTTAGFESCNKVKKLQDLVSAKEPQSDSATEAQIFKSQSSPLILNPHLFSSCHLQQRHISSITDTSCRILEFEASNKKLRNYQNGSDASTETSTLAKKSRPQLKELTASRNRGMHEIPLSDRTPASKYSPESYQSNILQGAFPGSRSTESPVSCGHGIRRRSVSDETLISRNLTEDQSLENQHNSLIRSQSKISSPTSRSLPEISKVFGLFRGLTHHTSSSNKISTLNNFSPTLRNNTKVQIPLTLSDSVLQRRHASFLSGDASTLRNRPEMLNDTKPSTIYLFEGQPSASMFQPIVSSRSFDQASTSRNQSGLLYDIDPPPMDVLERQVSTSSFQPIVTEVTSFNQAYFSASINRPAMRRNVMKFHPFVPMFEELTLIAGSSSVDQVDYSSGISTASSDAPQSRQARGTFEPSRNDEFVEYTDEARIILKAVLKKMMVHNGDICIWLRFECEKDSMKLCFLLTRYLANRGYKLWSESLFTTHHMTTEACAQVAYEKLISTVVSTLVLILRGALSRNYNAFFHNYLNFRYLSRDFIQNPVFINAEDVLDEVSRNRVEKLLKLMHRLLLRTSLAFRLLLMYIGEKCDEGVIERFELSVPEEDRMFLKRTYIF